MPVLTRRQFHIPSTYHVKRWRECHLVLFPLIALLFLFTLCLGIMTSPWEEALRRVLVLHLRYQLRRDVTVEQLAIDWGGHITLRGVTVAGDDAEEPLATLAALDIAFAPSRLLRSPLRPMSSITRITVDTPRVVVARDERGKWNFDELVTEGPEHPSPDRFAGEVVVRHGTVIYRDALGVPGVAEGPFAEEVTDVTARVTQGANGYYPFRVSGRGASGQIGRFDLRGSLYSEEQRLLCDVRVGAVELAHVARFLPDTLPMTVEAGSADARWQLLVERPEDTSASPRVTLTAIVDVAGARGHIALADRLPVAYRLERGQLRLGPDVAEFVGVQGTFDGVPVEIAGTVSDFSAPVLTLQLATRDAEARRVARLLPALAHAPMTFDGRMTGWAQVTGRPEALEVTAHLDGPTVTSDFGVLHEVRTDVRVSGNAVVLTDLQASAFGGEVRGGLWLSTDSNGADLLVFSGHVDGVALEQVTGHYLPPSAPDTVSLHDVQGRLSGPLTVRASREGTATVITQCTGDVSWPEVTSGHADAALRVQITDGRALVEVERCEVRTPLGDARLHGTIAPDALRLTVEARDVALEPVTALAALDEVTGTGFVTGKISGHPAEPAFAGTIHLRQGRVAQVRFDDVIGEVTAVTAPIAQVRVEHAQIVAGECRMLADAAVQGIIGSQGPWQLSGSVRLPRKTRVAALEEMFGVAASSLDGYVQGEITLSDVLGDMRGEGRVSLSTPSLQLADATLDFDQLDVPLRISDGRLHVAHAALTYQGTPIEINGSMALTGNDAQPHLLFHASTDGIDLDTLTALDEQGVGALTADAHVRMPLDVAGVLRAEASGRAQLYDAQGAFSPETLVRTLVVQAAVDIGNDILVVAGVPYRDVAARGRYDGVTQTILLEHFTAERSGPHHSSYRLALTGPGRLEMVDQEIDLGMALSCTNLNLLRTDLLLIQNGLVGSAKAAVAQVATTLREIPTPFAGRAQARVNVSGAMRAPLVDVSFDVADFMLAGNPLPDITAVFAYDASPRARMLRIEQLSATGGPDPDAFAEVAGTVTMPVMDLAGHEIEPGELNLSLMAQFVDLALLKSWIAHPALADLAGEAGVEAVISSTLTNPHVIASVDVSAPVVGGVPFDSLAAIITLEDNQLIIGRKVRTEQGERRIPITLQFAGADMTRIEPLEIYGELPLTWRGPLQPVLPTDAPVYLKASLPKQGLDMLRNYLPAEVMATYAPELTEESGTIEGTLEVAGTLLQPRIIAGGLRAESAELTFTMDDVDLPNVLRQVAVDIGIRSVIEDGQVINIVDVRDLSVMYDRVGDARPRRDPRFVAWVKSLLRMKQPNDPFRPGTVMAQGTIRIDPRRLLAADRQLIPLRDMPNHLEYDLYAKTVRTPFRWRDIFRGTVTSYLHLGNATDTAKTPQVTGVAYLEDGTISYSGKAAIVTTPMAWPINPRLSVALQSGTGNSFEILPTNPVLSAIFPFSATTMGGQLFAPSAISTVDPGVTPDGAVRKSPLDLGNLAYWYTSDTLLTTPNDPSQVIAGTRGALSGTLSAPIFEVQYELLPRKGNIRLPGGVLTVERGEGLFRLVPDEAPRLVARAEAHGRLDQYEIAAHIDGELLETLTEDSWQSMITPGVGEAAPRGRLLPITFETVSTPPGAPPLTDDEIATRLTGLNELSAIFSRDRETLGVTPLLYRAGSQWLLQGWLDDLARELGLDTVTFGFDPLLNPEATIITPELAKSRWSAIRLGASSTFSAETTWRLWMDYRIPESRWLRNIAITTSFDDEGSVDLNLQYRYQF